MCYYKNRPKIGSFFVARFRWLLGILRALNTECDYEKPPPHHCSRGRYLLFKHIDNIYAFLVFWIF